MNQGRARLILNTFSSAQVYFNIFFIKALHDFAEILENGVKPKQENISHRNLIPGK